MPDLACPYKKILGWFPEYAMTAILLIEDDPLLGAMLREMIELRGFEVSWIRSGVAARQLVGQDTVPDLVLTDIVMPDMDGLETLQYIQNIRPDVPVVAMSGSAHGGYLRLASRMGAKAVLQKPFDQDTLFEVLGRFLP